ETLREKKGYTYGVRSHFDARSSAGPFYVSASLETARLSEALDDLRVEMQALLGDRPPSPVEREDASRSLVESQARHFETPSSLVARFAGLFLHGLPSDYHESLSNRLQAVSVDSMLEAARRHIRPDRLIAVVVADAETTIRGLEKLDWGPVERIGESADG
ncbi:MAG TPA: insulinase family protein, partial [Isosphaeraceae bacterium]|nr:insulinase family protein [Isosphaeraceae bacterium]